MELSFLEELIVSWLVKIYLALHGIQRFIAMFKNPATGPYPELDKSSRQPPTLFPYDKLLIIFPSMPRSSEFYSLHTLQPAVCSNHSCPAFLILFYFTILIIFGEEDQ
jgi:hypothetical protein